MHLGAETKEAAETHHERTPRHRIDVRTAGVAGQQRLIDMQLLDVYFEGVGVHIFPEGAHVMYDALHLDGALKHARWSYRFRRCGSEPRDLKFVGFVTISPLEFLFRDGILARG